MIKKLLFTGVLSLLILSCNREDSNNVDFHYEFMPIVDVSLPDSFQYNEVYSIEYSYYRPSTCYYFNDLYYEATDNTRNIAVIKDIVIRSFQFICTETQGSYTFNFWIGDDSQGNPIYTTYEIPIE